MTNNNIEDHTQQASKLNCIQENLSPHQRESGLVTSVSNYRSEKVWFGVKITPWTALLLFILPLLTALPIQGEDATAMVTANLNELVGQSVDVAPSGYLYRADRQADENPPESWIGLMQYTRLPYTKPVDLNAPAIKKVICGLLWEEVRPVRRVELFWSGDAKRRPLPGEIALSFFDGQDENIHTWWNARKTIEAGQPEVSADGRTYVYTIPRDTWGVFVAVRTQQNASAYAVPALRAFVDDVWKKADIEIEWGFDDATANLEYDGRIEAYDGIIGDVRPLAGDMGTTITGPAAWLSAGKDGQRRGVRMSLLYMGASQWRSQWGFTTWSEDVARTIVTVWTKSGNFSFLAADLERGPILASEYGFFVRATATRAAAAKPAVPPRLELLQTKADKIMGNPTIGGWGSTNPPWVCAN
ncbi:MAG: hypothetical protein PHR35_15640, partial [Kiritimatiellae bacterium]|nr:hypothetical protein [Kiritimatiellia bacterium]